MASRQGNCFFFLLLSACAHRDALARFAPKAYRIQKNAYNAPSPFICKAAAVDAEGASAVSLEKVPTLNHEILQKGALTPLFIVLTERDACAWRCMPHADYGLQRKRCTLRRCMQLTMRLKLHCTTGLAPSPLCTVRLV